MNKFDIIITSVVLPLSDILVSYKQSIKPSRNNNHPGHGQGY